MTITPKLVVYFLVIFFLSMFLEDARFFVIMENPFKVTLIDIVYLIIFYYFFRSLLETTFFSTLFITKIYYAYLLIILVALFYGMYQWDLTTAIGGLKIFTPMFAITLPIFIVGKSRVNDTSYIVKLFKATIIVSAAGSLILFIIEVLYGGRFFFNKILSIDLGLDRMEDFRGIRYLGSQETFNILLLALLLIYHLIATKKFRLFEFVFSAIFILVAIITKNRTALLSLLLVFFLHILITQRKFVILIISIIVFITYTTIDFFYPKIVKTYIAPFYGVFNPESDITGSWRLYTNLAYVREGSKTPLLGKGLTNHYGRGVYVPELKEKIQYPPHNMFIIQFFQSGIFTTVLLLIFTIALSIKLYQINKSIINKPDFLQAVYLLFTITVTQLVYGQSYGYIWFFGLYSGYAILIILSVQRKADWKKLKENEQSLIV